MLELPWAKQTENRALNVYKGVIDKHYINRDDDIVMKELLVRAELLRRDFTKRQMNILLLIITFSYPYGKESALLPQVSDFELCGISKTKAREELDKLVEHDIINIADNYYTIKNPTEWKIPYHKGYVDTRSQELFMLNLGDADFDVEEIKRKVALMEKG